MKLLPKNLWPGNEAGGALIYAMLVGAILVVVSMELYRRTGLDLHMVQSGNVRAARNNLLDRLNAIAKLPEALYVSRNDSSIANCMVSNTCGSPGPEHLRAFRLLNPEGNSVAGSPADPVRYYQNGKVCTSSVQGECVFAAVSYLWSECRDGAASCAMPESLRVLIQITQIARVGKTRILPPVPLDSELTAKAPSLSSKVPLSSLLNLQLSCPAGSVAKQLGSGVQCQCLGVQTGTDSSGQPICQTTVATCAKGQVLTGVDGTGKPNCVELVDGCYFNVSVVGVECTPSECRESVPLKIDCKKVGEKFGRLRGIRHLSNVDYCTESGGNATCSIVFQYGCCI